MTKYAPSNVSLSADMGCDGMVVLSDTYYPGWYATVDGQPAQIYEVDLAFRGVRFHKARMPSPSGTARVRFSGAPASR